MPSEVYEVVAQGARYWFLFLMAVIVWRSYRWLAKDRRQRKKQLKLLPDAGFIGEFVVQSGNREMEEGAVMPVPREGILGRVRGSDLYIPAQGVAAKHLWFHYEEGKGLVIKPYLGQRASVDGEEVGRHTDVFMGHGSRLYVGEAVLRLRMFAGFETTVRASAYGMEAMPEAGEGSETREGKGAHEGCEAHEGSEAHEGCEAREAGEAQAAMLAERVALWQAQQNAMQQQYWLMAQEAMAERMAAGENEPDEPEEDDIDWDEARSGEGGKGTLYAQAYEESEDLEPEEDDNHGYVVLTDDKDVGADDERRSKAARSLFSPFEPVAGDEPPAPARETTFGTSAVFYPPVQDDTDTGDPWPYAEYPKSGAVFENQGYTYPEYVGQMSEDEDLTDAAAPPKSLYVEPDEAEHAKRLLWDKYFGGGKKR